MRVFIIFRLLYLTKVESMTYNFQMTTVLTNRVECVDLDFKLNSLRYWKPMKVFENRRNMAIMPRVKLVCVVPFSLQYNNGIHFYNFQMTVHI